MNKVLTVLSIFILSVVAVYAEPTVSSVMVCPLNATFNIDLTSEYYPTHPTGDDVYLIWDPGITNDDENVFTDNAIIGIAEFNYYGITSDETLYYSIDVSSASGAYEFISQSDPAYKRPYKIYVSVAWNKSDRSQNRWGAYEVTNEDSTERKPVPYEYEYHESGTMVFDIIIALPDSANIDDGVLNYEGKNYFIGEKDDYATMITATISITTEDGTEVDKAVVSFPCTGYVSNSNTVNTDLYSLLVTPTHNISNIQLSKTGTTQKIANIDFLYGVNKNSETPIGNPAIFISSSNNPYDSGAERFRFVHTDATNFITSRNSITYKLVVSDGKSRTEFDGTDYLDSGAYDFSGLENQLRIQSTKAYYNNQSFWTSWWYYNGEINLILDSHPDILNAGRYESSIYIHVMSL